LSVAKAKKIQKEIKRYSTIYIVGGSTLIYPSPHIQDCPYT
jgi:hypothetical protein